MPHIFYQWNVRVHRNGTQDPSGSVDEFVYFGVDGDATPQGKIVLPVIVGETNSDMREASFARCISMAVGFTSGMRGFAPSRPSPALIPALPRSLARLDPTEPAKPVANDRPKPLP